MLPIGLCAYGIPYSIGYVGRGTSRANPAPLAAQDLIELAVRLDLCGVELPVELIAPAGDGAALDAFRQLAEAHNLALTVDTPPLAADAYPAHLQHAKRLGARVVRTMLSTVLCGDRRSCGGLDGWQRLLDERIACLKAVAPVAEDLGILIGVENHQDATSEELVRLCKEVDSPNVGITLDTGNPLAVAEDPVCFAQRILPHLVHVHLKDYRMAASASGYRLFHCPIGAGVVDFPALFALFRTKPDVAMNLEMAMLGERHIRVLDDDYWAGHTPRPVTELLPVLRLWRNAETGTDWRTPWETGEDAGIAEWELGRLKESVEIMRRIILPSR